jgi:hypothetical protein
MVAIYEWENELYNWRRSRCRFVSPTLPRVVWTYTSIHEQRHKETSWVPEVYECRNASIRRCHTHINTYRLRERERKYSRNAVYTVAQAHWHIILLHAQARWTPGVGGRFQSRFSCSIYFSFFFRPTGWGSHLSWDMFLLIWSRGWGEKSLNTPLLSLLVQYTCYTWHDLWGLLFFLEFFFHTWLFFVLSDTIIENVKAGQDSGQGLNELLVLHLGLQKKKKKKSMIRDVGLLLERSTASTCFFA